MSGPEALPLTAHATPQGPWPWELRDPDGPVYRAQTEAQCLKWARARDKWFAGGREFAVKSRTLDCVPGQLVHDKGGNSYGVRWST